MKKIPYALTLLVAYIIMTYRNFATAFGDTGTFASVVLVLAPVVLAVLLIVNRKKDVSQIAAIVCLVMSAFQLYSACTLFASVMETLRMSEGDDYVLIGALPTLGHLALGGLLAWFAGAHIQDGETTGGYKFLAFLAIVFQLFFGFGLIGSGFGYQPLALLTNLIMILIYWHLPNAFVNYSTAKKTKISHLVILVLLVGVYLFGQEALMNALYG